VVVDKVTFLVLGAAMIAALAPDSWAFTVTALVVGTGCTSFGAYVGARFAGSAFLAHGLLIGAVALAISVARFILFALDPPVAPGAVHPLWWELLGWLLLVGAGVVGGTLAKRQTTSAAV